MEILLDCLSDTWLIIGIFLTICWFAKRDQAKREREKKWYE